MCSDSVNRRLRQTTDELCYSSSRDKLLNVIIDSRLGQLPDFLEGRISTDTSDFHVGSYIKEGSRVESSVISGESIRVHPLKPFGVRINRAGRVWIQISNILKDYDQNSFAQNKSLLISALICFHFQSSTICAGDFEKTVQRFVKSHIIPFAFTFSASETPPSVWISSVNERGRTVPEHALMNEQGQTSDAAAV